MVVLNVAVTALASGWATLVVVVLALAAADRHPARAMVGRHPVWQSRQRMSAIS
jgi:hypothetical protein